MFEELTGRIQEAVRRITGRAYITDANIRDAVNQLKRALLASDVHYQVVKSFIQRVKDRAIGEKVSRSLSPGEAFIRIVYEELVRLLGEGRRELVLRGRPAVVFLVGLQGSGKTTLCAKLGRYLFEEWKRSVLLVGADTWRPASVAQLRTLAERAGLPFYGEEGVRDAVSVVRGALSHARAHGFEVVVVDTAGRQVLQEELMEELERLVSEARPSEVLYVLDAMMGQDAVHIAKEFYGRIRFTGVALTKMDGDARGGAALTVFYMTGVPVKVVSVGEGLDDLEWFDPERYVRRILGIGDLEGALEKIQRVVRQEEVRQLATRIKKDELDLNDLLKQIQMVRRMGSGTIRQFLGLLPGVGKAVKNIPEETFDRLRHVEAIILSMTPEERANPEIIDYSRKMRIARGSGRPLHEVNRLLKQFRVMRKAFRRALRTGGGRRGPSPQMLQQLLMGFRR